MRRYDVKYYIYAIYFQNEIIYIGSTSNIEKRELSHNKNLRKRYRCVIENDLYNVISILRNDYEMELINNKTLKTFYWDYSDLDRQEDLKSYIRDQKINNILK